MASTKTRKTRKPASEAQKAEWQAARDEKLAAAHAQLQEGVEALQNGEQWKAYLDTASKFHRYSFGNVMLLLQQGMVRGMDISQVAGFRKWKELGRFVRKGETGLAVLAPVKVLVDGNGERVRGRMSPEQKKALGIREQVVGWTTRAVFDISQTDGEDLPDVRPVILQGEGDERLWEQLVRVAASEGYAVDLTDEEGSSHGWADWLDEKDRAVHVRASRPAAQRVKTLAHEIGHVLLGHTADRSFVAGAARDVAEVEAESVAYVILQAVGYDAGDYSLPYVAGWAGSASAEVLQETATRVLAAARKVLDQLDIDGDTDDTDSAE